MNDPGAVDVVLFSSPRPPWISPKAFEVSENSCPPLGLLYLAGALEGAGFKVRVEDFYRFGGKPADVVKVLEESRPRIVGVSSLTSGFELAVRLCRHAKKHSVHVITVVGGPHATALPEHALQDLAIDLVVRGEGEQTLVELALASAAGPLSPDALSRIPGLAYRVDGKVVLTPDRPLLDIDAIPEPARHLVPIRDYLQPGAVMASRGCPHGCFFCSSVSFNSHLYRFRSADLVLVELDRLHREFGLQEFEFLDDVLTSNAEWLEGLCRQLAQRGFRWGCQATIKDVTAHTMLLDSMAAGGCRGVFFGIESGNAEVLRKVKGLRVTDVLPAVDRSVSLGMSVITSFIIGHPWDTRETIKDTVGLMKELRSRGCHTPVSILVPFPGSALATHPDRFGIRIESLDYTSYYHSRAVLSTRHLTREDLEELYFGIVSDLTSVASAEAISVGLS